jgi:hypothetical protein
MDARVVGCCCCCCNDGKRQLKQRRGGDGSGSRRAGGGDPFSSWHRHFVLAAVVFLIVLMLSDDGGGVPLRLPVALPCVQAWVVVTAPTGTTQRSPLSRNQNRNRHFVSFSNRVDTADFGKSSQNGTATTLPQGARSDDGSSSSSTPETASWSLERTAAHLQKLQRQQEKLQKRNFARGMDAATAAGSGAALSRDAASATTSTSTAIPNDPLTEERERLYQVYLRQAATELKRLLSARELPTKGRKPDLARRLARDDLETQYGWTDPGKQESYDTEDDNDLSATDAIAATRVATVTTFGALTRLSQAASMALTRAQFTQPFAIQTAALAWIVQRQSSCILHAATGSGTPNMSYECRCLRAHTSLSFCTTCATLFLSLYMIRQNTSVLAAHYRAAVAKCRGRRTTLRLYSDSDTRIGSASGRDCHRLGSAGYGSSRVAAHGSHGSLGGGTVATVGIVGRGGRNGCHDQCVASIIHRVGHGHLPFLVRRWKNARLAHVQAASHGNFAIH